jgi:hypothetical protein
MSDFLNDPKKIRIENDKVVMPTFLRWYADDFAALGGLVAYITSQTDGVQRADEKELDAKITADYPKGIDFRYDWTLNSKANKPK